MFSDPETHGLLSLAPLKSPFHGVPHPPVVAKLECRNYTKRTCKIYSFNSQKKNTVNLSVEGVKTWKIGLRMFKAESEVAEGEDEGVEAV